MTSEAAVLILIQIVGHVLVGYTMSAFGETFTNACPCLETYIRGVAFLSFSTAIQMAVALGTTGAAEAAIVRKTFVLCGPCAWNLYGVAALLLGRCQGTVRCVAAATVAVDSAYLLFCAYHRIDP